MDDEIEAMCGCDWTVSFEPSASPLIVGCARHMKYGVVSARQSNTRKLTERLFIAASKLDPVLQNLEDV